MSMTETLWTLDRVSLGQRLRDVTLHISGGVTAVLGPSGAGKTSLLNLLVGFEQPEAGTITAPFAQGKRARPIFWAPQGEGLWPHLTVREHVAVMGSRETDALLDEFDLAARAGARPETLSQGERARLAVARALAADAAVLVMDEPLAHVDSTRVGQYWDVLSRRLLQAGTSLVFATHVPGTVLGQAQQVICLREARVVNAGGVCELYETPATAELAGCLGEANWIEPADARVWLQREDSTAHCYRPERIAIEPAADGVLRVEAARFHGAVAEAILRHEGSGATRRFWHRPAGNGLARGMLVNVTVISGR